MTNKPFTAINLEKLLSRPESRQLEFKRVGNKHGRILETICAFANSDGGLLVIGVGDAKELKPGERPERRLWGIEENAEAFDDLQRLVMQRFTPPIESNFLDWSEVQCTLRGGRPGRVVMLRVSKSDKVHSVYGGSTWTRMDSSNRQLSAAEILELSYRRGVKSSEADPLPIDLRLLETATWQTFVTSRGVRNGTFAEQLMRLGLATEANGVVLPTKAAVLLFADEPGSLLAAHGARADVRVLVYDGKAATPTATPNYRKQPRTVRGPLIEQIDKTVRLVLDEIAQGVTLTGSGFKARHAYPERVVKEAIVNAVIHRDYRLNRDIFIRIFDDSIEVESPGTFLGPVNAMTIAMRTGGLWRWARRGSPPRLAALARSATTLSATSPRSLRVAHKSAPCGVAKPRKVANLASFCALPGALLGRNAFGSHSVNRP
jgi:ATP-dependent DNA helicase RecG